MKRDVKNLIILVVSVLLFGLGIFFMISDYIQYGILTIVIDIVIFIVLFKSFNIEKDPIKSYELRIKSTLNTYDSILVRNKEIPNLENRNIIMLYNFEDLVNAQIELRKPICYIKQTESCSFILLDGSEAWVYIDKVNDAVVSPVEIEINNLKRVLKNESEIDQKILKEIEKTTIIKLPNAKTYKISPIRDKEIKNSCESNKAINKEKKDDKEVEIL